MSADIGGCGMDKAMPQILVAVSAGGAAFTAMTFWVVPALLRAASDHDAKVWFRNALPGWFPFT